MNATLRKRFSPLTRPIGPSVGPDKVNLSVTVILKASCLLDRMAALWSVSRNFMCRRFLASGASAENHPQAAELRQALGLSSIHDVTTPKAKAMIFERELRTMRPSNAEWVSEYLKGFQP